MDSSENVRLRELGFALETVPDENDPGDTRLVLRDLRAGQKQLPLAVDFLDSSLLYRLTHGFGAQQPLGRALGVKSRAQAPSVFDATAGFGTDAFFMAALGCRVRAVERSPTVAALLLDGLRRLRAAVARGEELERVPAELLRSLSANLSFEPGEAAEILSGLAAEARPEVVYLDPMFPEEGRSESAAPKKTMQMFRRLLGPDADSGRLFEVARQSALKRVVVKRPIQAGYLADMKPNHSFAAKSARFDMYLVGSQPQEPERD